MGEKLHNSAVKTKTKLREVVLTEVRPARVLDAYCGPVGEMHAAVWARADAYLGIDSEWRIADQRQRIMGDNAKVLRVLDLQRFNVFDLDAFGSPWELAVTIQARRKWAPGERGAVVITDGSSMKSRWGSLPHAAAQLLGQRYATCEPRVDLTLTSRIIDAWLRGCRLTATTWLKASGNGSGKGRMRMEYHAVVFQA